MWKIKLKKNVRNLLEASKFVHERNGHLEIVAFLKL